MVNNVNGVFYATTYHPIQAGSIDGTDITAHDNGVFRALLASATGLYDPLGDPKAEGDPYCSLFVSRLSAQTDENSLRQAMSKFGRVKNLRLVRHVVTGASCGYAFVEFETEKDMRVAYEEAHLSKLDGASILVDYNRQQLMSGWIPRRLGGGLGGKKESGQLRFGGRDRPFRAPLRPIPHEELRKLGIPLPPEGRYMTRFQVPPLPQQKQNKTSENDGSSKTVKDKDAIGSEAEEARERDRHRRRRRGEFSDQDYLETESRGHRKHRINQESSKYEGHLDVEPKRSDSGDEEERHGRRKRRKEQSLEYDEEDRKRRRSERRNRSERNEPDPEQSRSRNAEIGDVHGRHRYRSESDDRHLSRESDHTQLSRESEKKHHRHKHRHRDREEGSPSHEDYEGKHHRSSRKHHKSTGKEEEKEKKKSKHRERDNI